MSTSVGMSDDNAGIQSVTEEQKVSVDPMLLNKPVRPDEQGEGSDLLKHKLGLANQHAKTAKKEADDLRAQLSELQGQLKTVQDAQATAVRQNLEDQGAFKDLYEQERNRAKELESRYLNETAELKTQLQSVAESAKQEKLRASAMSTISRADAVNPQQMFTLLQTMVRSDDEGNPVVLNGGVEQPLGDYIANLKQSQDWQHHFSASSSRGMGTTASSSVAPGMSNPYRNGNLTEALRIEVENPDLAKALKAEASRQ